MVNFTFALEKCGDARISLSLSQNGIGNGMDLGRFRNSARDTIGVSSGRRFGKNRTRLNCTGVAKNAALSVVSLAGLNNPIEVHNDTGLVNGVINPLFGTFNVV